MGTVFGYQLFQNNVAVKDIFSSFRKPMLPPEPPASFFRKLNFKTIIVSLTSLAGLAATFFAFKGNGSTIVKSVKEKLNELFTTSKERPKSTPKTGTGAELKGNAPATVESGKEKLKEPSAESIEKPKSTPPEASVSPAEPIETTKSTPTPPSVSHQKVETGSEFTGFQSIGHQTLFTLQPNLEINQNQQASCQTVALIYSILNHPQQAEILKLFKFYESDDKASLGVVLPSNPGKLISLKKSDLRPQNNTQNLLGPTLLEEAVFKRLEEMYAEALASGGIVEEHQSPVDIMAILFGDYFNQKAHWDFQTKIGNNLPEQKKIFEASRDKKFYDPTDKTAHIWVARTVNYERTTGNATRQSAGHYYGVISDGKTIQVTNPINTNIHSDLCKRYAYDSKTLAIQNKPTDPPAKYIVKPGKVYDAQDPSTYSKEEASAFLDMFDPYLFSIRLPSS